VAGLLIFLYYSPISGMLLFLIGLFLIQAARNSYKQILVRSALSGIPIRELMTHPVIFINSWLTIDELVNDYFIRYPYSGFPVMDDGVLKGIAIAHDANQIPRMEWINRRVSDILKPIDEKYKVSEELDAVDALTKMLHQDIQELLVIKNQEVIGIVTLRDVMSLFKMKTDLGN